ncbi:autotransporter assembly complex protein TamA [Shewanella litoralis]|uniref:Translocation and assembly module subunit TamA n=1 Tax=Shewanella litoralis TaxID=2282700 RepID=A0ABQ2RBH5_9GAMM|nr:autotransporter assembly complex family protein [Shewanella litoralis]GGQ20629.1 outer membrane protein assembly factor [Shewanella litoralis]
MSGFALAENSWLNVRIDGVSKKLEKNIIAHLGTLPESDVQRRAFLFTVDDNTQDALESMGYYHGIIDIDVQETDSGPWELNLNITTGDPVIIQWVDINFSGEMLQDDRFAVWLNSLNIKPGDTLNHGVYDALKSQLVTLALARGYFDGRYTKSEISINRDFNTAQINIQFDSGKRYLFGEVDFAGSTLNDDVIEALIPFDADAPYATQQLTEFNRNLLDTGYFSNIKVLPQIDKISDGVVPIKVELSPRPSHLIEVGLGADIGNSTEDTFEPRVRVTWRTPQINRYGHYQETSAEWSPDRPKILTTYTIPLSHPLDDQLKIKLGILRDTYGVTQDYDEESRSFDNTGQLESKKYLIGLSRQQRSKSNWLYGYSVESIREFYEQLDTEYDPRFLLMGYNLTKTVRGDNTLDPKSGFRQTYSMEYADPSLGSTIRLARFQARFKWIETFFDKHRFVARLDLGANIASRDDISFIPPSLRYFAGGDQSIRGYSYQELGPYIDYTNSDGGISRQVVGGRYLAIGSLEYQYYLTPTWRVASFVDAGNAFDTGQLEPVVAVGGGVHWISPIGPIKLDLGFGLKETETVARSFRFHLTMGTEL